VIEKSLLNEAPTDHDGAAPGSQSLNAAISRSLSATSIPPSVRFSGASGDRPAEAGSTGRLSARALLVNLGDFAPVRRQARPIEDHQIRRGVAAALSASCPFAA